MIYQFFNLHKYDTLKFNSWLQNEAPYVLLHEIDFNMEMICVWHFQLEACIYNPDPENPDPDRTRIRVRAGKFLLKLTQAGSGPANNFRANPDLS